MVTLIDKAAFNTLIQMIVPDLDQQEYISSEILNYLNNHAVQSLLVAIAISLLKIQSRIFFFTKFTELSQKQREKWLSKSTQAWRNLLLKLLALIIKFTYLQSPDLHKSLGSRIQLAKVTAEKFRWQQQIVPLHESDLNDDFEVDAIVIGTGAGGAVAAYELASRGLAVLIIEEGDYFDRGHFNGDIPKLIKSLYRNMGMTSSFGNTIIPIPLGRNVGGTTTINSGTCLRASSHVINDWKEQGLVDFNAESLSPWYEKVEDILEVQPAENKSVGNIAQVITVGAKKLGYEKTHVLNRNATGCDGQGLCQLGCPTDAKRSTNVSYIPRALDAGAMLVTSAKATKIQWHNGEVKAVTITEKENPNKKVSIKTKTAVVAMGSLLTPSFLSNNGIKNKWLGKNLSIHPCGAVNAHFPDNNFSNSRKIPQGFGVSDKKNDGLMLEGATPPLLAYGLMIKDTGHEFVNKIHRYQQTGFFGFMIKDTSRGRVYSKKFKGLPLVHYHINKKDFTKFIEGTVALSRIYLAAGAKEVEIAGSNKIPKIKNEDDINTLLSLNLKPRDFLITAYHPLGSCRMAQSKSHGVVDTNLQVHGKKGLFVMDGSVIPTALGANPQLTIMAIASKCSAHLANQLTNEN